MSSPIGIVETARLLASVREKGARIWSESGRLHYKAPRGALSPEEIELLRMSSRQLIELLDASAASGLESRPLARAERKRAPLTFSQLAHWRAYELNQKPSMRSVAYAASLNGSLSVGALEKSLEAIMHRHAALRTRIVVRDGAPEQEITDSCHCDLVIANLTDVPATLHEGAVQRAIEQLMLQPIDLATGPLFSARLLKLRDREHVFIIVVDHVVSDGFSLAILWRDLFAAYRQALRGADLVFPTAPIQFGDYAAWQSSTHAEWLAKHGAYWVERLSGCERLALPRDADSQAAGRIGWERVPFHIGQDLRAQLLEWCRKRRTTLVMCVFSAYVALVARWCNVGDLVVQFQSTGRAVPALENTVGHFTSRLCLRVSIREQDEFAELLHRVTEEYCNACEHADFSYLAAQDPPPGVTRNTTFNWLPQGSMKIDDLAEIRDSRHALHCAPIRFVPPTIRTCELDSEPEIVLLETGAGILGSLYFPLNRFATPTMERFSRNFVEVLTVLTREPPARVKDLWLRD